MTAKDEEKDIVQGLDLGAEDYIVKPFRLRELISRIKVVLRRYNKMASSVVSCKGVKLTQKKQKSALMEKLLN